MSVTSIFRATPWLAVILIAVLSLVPGWLRPHTGLPGPAEHFLAYFLNGFLLATQMRSAGPRAAALALLCLYAGSLEILQNWIPGRDADFTDFLAGSIGAICGMAIFAMIQLRWQRRSGKRVK